MNKKMTKTCRTKASKRGLFKKFRQLKLTAIFYPGRLGKQSIPKGVPETIKY
jgi:hypothetical protein